MKIVFRSIEDAVDILIDSSKKHSAASEKGDYKTANKNFNLIQKAVHFLRDNHGINKLEELLYNEDVSVRLATASFFLVHDKEKAVSVLKNIIALSIPHKSFEAKMVLDEFNKGNLKL